MTDQTTTPAEVIAREIADRHDEPRVRRIDADDANGILDALAAAGFVVRPLPDDETRREVERLLGHLRHDMPGWLDTMDRFVDLAAEAGVESAKAIVDAEGPADQRTEMQDDMRRIADLLAAAFLTEGPQG